MKDEKKTKAQLISELRELRQKLAAGNSDQGLLENEKRFRTLFENAPLGCQSLDAEGNFLEVNETWCKTLGYRKEEVIGRNFSEFIDPDFRKVFKDNFPNFKSLGSILGVEFEMIKKDGSTIFVSYDGKINYEHDGSFRQTHCVFKDISERKLAEHELQQSEGKFRAIANYTVDWESWFGTDGKYLWVNPAVERMTGYSADEILAMPDFITTLIAEEDRAQVAIRFQEALQGGRGSNYEFRILRKEGTQLWVGASWQSIFDSQGNSLGVRVSCRDITERKRAEQELKESEQRYRTLSEATFEGIAFSEAGVLIDANTQLLKILGYKYHEIIGKPVIELIHPDDREEVKRKMNISYNKPYENRVICKDGSVITVETRASHFLYRGRDIRVTALRDITERQRAVEELKQSEKSFRTLIESAPEAIFVQSRGRFDYVNPAMLELFGASTPEELLGKEIMERMAPEYHEAIRERIRMQRKTGKAAPLMEQEYLRLDGSRVPVETTAIAMRFEDREAHMVFVRDITDRKLAEKALRESGERYRLLFDGITDAVYVHEVSHNTPGKFVAVNDAACRMLGYSKEELLQMEVKDIDMPEQREVMPFIQEKLFRDRHVLFETSHIAKDGRKIPVEVNIRFFAWMGKPMVLSVARDITERKTMENALREAYLFAQSTIDALMENICVLDETGTILAVNRSWRVFAGENPPIPPDYCIGTNYLEICDSAHGPNSAEAAPFAVGLRAVLHGEQERFVLEYPCNRPDGEERWFKARITAFGMDKVNRVVVSHENITERKKAEEALRKSEQELQLSYFAQATINMILSESLEDAPLDLILQKSLDMILSQHWLSFEPIGSIHLIEDQPDVFVMKAQHNLADRIKQACSRIQFGKCHCGKAARAGKIQFVLHRNDEHEVCSTGKSEQGHYIVPILFKRKTLGILNIYTKAGHIRNHKEEEFLSAVADTLAGVIVRKLAEDAQEKLNTQLLQSQKMEAVGLLAGGIAHDFNNILTAIMGFGYILRTKINQDDPLRLYPERILVASEKAIQLTRNLLDFSRKRITDLRAVNIHDVITEVNKLLVRIIGEDIELQVELSHEDIIVMADAGQIEHLLMNLAINARDAMPEGGRLTIRTDTIWMDSKFITSHGYGKAGKYALVSVSDTGKGMEKYVIQKIFEPFFTTKEAGKGTGLGLSMVYGIVQQHDGYINVYSEPGAGTTFRIYLPVTERKEEKAGAIDMVTPRRGTETILLAEDNEEVRVFTEEILEDFGYRVIEAIDGEDAVRQFTANRDKIQLLLLDVIMPKKNGKEAYDEIRLAAPEMKAIFLSGYPAEVIQRKGILGKKFDIILKPVSPHILLNKIREMLDK